MTGGAGGAGAAVGAVATAASGAGGVGGEIDPTGAFGDGVGSAIASGFASC